MFLRNPLTVILTVCCGLLVPTANLSAEPTAELPLYFQVDVQAALSKAGCNAGACHGNQNGKGGFRLSLRGQDPHFDFRSIAVQHDGRRIDTLRAAESLLLLKPTMQVAHQGGQRLKAGDLPYEILRRWIADGAAEPASEAPRVTQLVVTPTKQICFAPQSEVQLDVIAEFDNGQHQDVTSLAVYEASNLIVDIAPNGLVQRRDFGEVTVTVRYLDRQVPVRLAFLPHQADFRWSGPEPQNFVDQFVFAKLREFRQLPAPLADDHVFVRRAFIDTLGIPPTAAESKAFVQDPRPHKRQRLVDDLLSRPEFADHWALKWSDLLRVEEKLLDRRGVDAFHSWIRDSIATGKPLDQFVAEILVATGSTYDVPPTNYWRALRKPNERGEATARVFLGTRLQCAQCHNHPFDRWTQNDYYAWSALFARVDYEIIENEPDDKLDKNQFKGEQVVLAAPEGDVKHPEDGRTMSPRFLGADATISSSDERLRALADWLTSPDNKQFARSQVNRLWFHLMGRGLVEPVDDFRSTNPASHPELLESLADDFIRHGFDIRHTIRRIMSSATYQLSSQADVPEENYARAAVRRLTAEQLLDAQSLALRAAIDFNGFDRGKRAGQLPGVHKVRIRSEKPSDGDRFLFAFGKPERLMTCECERGQETTLSQALLMVNGPCMDELLTQSGNRIDQLIQAETTTTDSIRDLYWHALSRGPSAAELAACVSICESADDLRVGLQDVAWALLNAKEFVFRH